VSKESKPPTVRESIEIIDDVTNRKLLSRTNAFASKTYPFTFVMEIR